MKEIMKFSLFVLFFAVVLVSCSKEKNEEPLQDLQDKSMTYEDFFQTVTEKEVNLPENKVLFISYEYNKQDYTITLLSATESNPSSEIASIVASERNKFNSAIAAPLLTSKYTIHCKGSSNGDWTKTCNSKLGCRNTIHECVDAGGCATMCKANMVYIPDIKAFYISADIDELVSSKVEGL